MKSLIKVDNKAYRPTNEEIKQELVIKNLCDNFVKTLNQEQRNGFVEILTTHKVCIYAFKLK